MSFLQSIVTPLARLRYRPLEQFLVAGLADLIKHVVLGDPSPVLLDAEFDAGRALCAGMIAVPHELTMPWHREFVFRAMSTDIDEHALHLGRLQGSQVAAWVMLLGSGLRRQQGGKRQDGAAMAAKRMAELLLAW